MLEGLAEDEQERAVDAQVLPIVALAKRLQERTGLAGAQGNAEGVGGPETRGGLRGADGLLARDLRVLRRLRSGKTLSRLGWARASHCADRRLPWRGIESSCGADADDRGPRGPCRV